MKVLSVSRLCLAGVLIVAMIVAWGAAMPSHMSHDRLAMVGGSCDCEYQSISHTTKNCPSSQNCSGSYEYASTRTSGSPNLYIIKDGDECGGSGDMCKYYNDDDISTDCNQG